MLVLSRKVGERIEVEGGIVFTVLEVRGSRVRIGVEAPDDLNIVRSELRWCDVTATLPKSEAEAPAA